jgi:hypothetical protein
MKSKKYTALKEDEFNLIKLMLDQNIKMKNVILATERSYTTVKNVHRFETFDKYIEYVRETLEKSAAKKQSGITASIPTVVSAAKVIILEDVVESLSQVHDKVDKILAEINKPKGVFRR